MGDYTGGHDTQGLCSFLRSAAEETSKPRPAITRLIDFSMTEAQALLQHEVQRQLMIFGDTDTLAKHRKTIEKASAELGYEEDHKINMLILLLDTTVSSLRNIIHRFEVPFGASDGKLYYRAADFSRKEELQVLAPKEEDSLFNVSAVNAPGNILGLCRKVDRGQFVRLLRSAKEIPSTPYLPRNVVEEILGNQFVDKVVNDDENDSVVFFYMPGCMHCKALKPSYAKVASEMPIDNPKMKFFIIDGTKNDVENTNVKGYPTMYFYPRGSKQTPKLIKDREEMDLRRFLKANYQGGSGGGASAADASVAAANAAAAAAAAANVEL